MATGGGINIISQKGNGNGNRGRPFGLMLLLAFGAALLGVMTLHKLREKRIFNLLVEEEPSAHFSSAAVAERQARASLKQRSELQS